MYEVKILESKIVQLQKRETAFPNEFDEELLSIRDQLKVFRFKFRKLKEADDKNYLAFESGANKLFPLLISIYESHMKDKENIQQQIMYLRMIGDLKRYLIEINNDNDNKTTYIQEALVIYRECITLCEGNLKMSDYYYISTLLNYTVFLADELYEIEEAISLTEKAINSVIKNELDEECKKIYEVMEGNLAYYKENKEIYKSYQN